MTTSIGTTTSFRYDSRQLAETYDRLSDLQFESGKKLVQHLGALDGARVLDVGCGTGRLARWIAESVVGPSGSVVGVDPLPERIAIARARVSGIRFEVAQAEDLSAFAPESFDAVSMSSVFHWVTDKARALAEVRRVLKPSGRFALTTMSRELSDAGTLHSVLNALLRKAPYAGRIDPGMPLAALGQTTTDLLETVLASELELEQLHITPRSSTRANGEEVLAFLESSSFGNFLRSAPDELRGALRKDLAEAFDAHKGPDGIVIKNWLTLLVATKKSAGARAGS